MTKESLIPKKKTKQEEFEALALEHLNPLYGMAMSLTRNKADAEDLVQESIIKAFRAFDSFEKGTNIKAWLFKILKNTFISNWRKKKNVKEEKPIDDMSEFSFYSAAYPSMPKSPEGVPSDDVFNADKLEHVLGDEVKKALDSLPEEYREAIFLCDIQGLAYQEIADILSIPIGTVRSRLARARSSLQKLLWDYAKESGLWRANK